MNSDEIFNASAFLYHLGEDRELGIEILKVYLSDAPERVSSLSKGFEENDIDLVVKYSHALKGITATIRAPRLAQIAEATEVAARKGDIEESRSYFLSIESELEKLLAVLKEYLRTGL
ncbi:Hpt domain-containing protein [Maridesulfovibrio frigidus]|uniref:Hpt domain-containing protein n=1 Tax=Maridesulfovibrio frigidus TaxID=340956 RepID=UPI0004E26BE9|nr:Hpt domain-containing protein [Maridesulfovibrio frigidus]